MTQPSHTTPATRSEAANYGPETSRLIAITALLSISVVLILTMLYRHVDETRALIRDQALEIAATVAELARFEVAANDRVALAFRLEAFTRFSQVRAMVIMDRREQPLAAVQRNSAGNLSALPQATIALDRMGGDASPPSSLRRLDESFIVRAAIGEIAPIGWVYLEHDNGWLIDARRRLLIGGAASALLLGATLVLLWRLRCVR